MRDDIGEISGALAEHIFAPLTGGQLIWIPKYVPGLWDALSAATFCHVSQGVNVLIITTRMRFQPLSRRWSECANGPVQVGCLARLADEMTRSKCRAFR